MNEFDRRWLAKTAIRWTRSSESRSQLNERIAKSYQLRQLLQGIPREFRNEVDELFSEAVWMTLEHDGRDLDEWFKTGS